MKTITLILPFLFSLLSSAQEKPKKETVNPNVRPESELILKFHHKIKIVRTKRLDDSGVLHLFPGDTVHLEFQKLKGKLVNPKVVEEIKHPKRSITFEMTQDESITMLFRKTQIQKTVAVDCEHRGLRSDKFAPTNLQPTEKGLMIGDSWPNTVWAIKISNIRVSSKSAEQVYREKVSKQANKANKSQ